MNFFRKHFLSLLVFSLGLIFVAMLFPYFTTSNHINDKQYPIQMGEPQFKHQGNLSIHKPDGSLLTTFEIEVAQTPEQTTLGLMYRKSMNENRGMLFIFDSEQERSFWMLNTYISLDIIYLNAQKQIVGIAKNASPLTTDSQPSNAPAQYALEINAGLSDKLGIEIGDKVNFEIF